MYIDFDFTQHHLYKYMTMCFGRLGRHFEWQRQGGDTEQLISLTKFEQIVANLMHAKQK